MVSLFHSDLWDLLHFSSSYVTQVSEWMFLTDWLYLHRFFGNLLQSLQSLDLSMCFSSEIQWCRFNFFLAPEFSAFSFCDSFWEESRWFQRIIFFSQNIYFLTFCHQQGSEINHWLFKKWFLFVPNFQNTFNYILSHFLCILSNKPIS